jgi:hypothetical protein
MSRVVLEHLPASDLHPDPRVQQGCSPAWPGLRPGLRSFPDHTAVSESRIAGFAVTGSPSQLATAGLKDKEPGQ